MTLLVSLSTLASAQSHGTESTAITMIHLLNYCVTHSEAVIRYKKSDMILAIHSDASYLYEPKLHSRAGGHFFLTNKKNEVNL